MKEINDIIINEGHVYQTNYEGRVQYLYCIRRPTSSTSILSFINLKTDRLLFYSSCANDIVLQEWKSIKEYFEEARDDR